MSHKPIHPDDYLTWKSVILRCIWFPLVGTLLGLIPVYFFGHITAMLLFLEALSVVILTAMMAVAEHKTRQKQVKLETILWQLIERDCPSHIDTENK